MPSPDRTRASVVIASGIGLTTLTALPLFLTGTLSVSIGRDLDLEPSVLGTTLAAYFVAVSSLSALLGRFVERIGWRRGMQISALIAAGSLGATATLASTWQAFVVALAVAGTAHAIGQPSVNRAISETADPRRHAFVFAVKQSSVPVAIFLGGAAVPVVALTVGWRWAYGGAAVVAAVIAAAVPGRASPSAAPSPVTATRSATRGMAPIGLVGALGGGSAAALAGFVVAYAVERGIAEETAGTIVAAGSLLGIGARLALGWILDARRSDGTPAIGVLLAFGAAGVGLIASGSEPVIVAGSLIAFAGAWGWQGAFVFAVVRRYPASTAAATGLGQSFSSGGGVIGPLVFGWIVGQASYATAWTVTACWLLMGSAVAIWVGRSRPGRSPQQQ